MTYPIADLFTRINNAKAAKKAVVKIPYSNYKVLILNVLSNEGFVSNVKTDKESRSIVVSFGENSRHFERMRVISKPSSKIYSKKNNIPRSKGGFGTILLSTPGGVMTDTDARKKGLGGEIICEVF